MEAASGIRRHAIMKFQLDRMVADKNLVVHADHDTENWVFIKGENHVVSVFVRTIGSAIPEVEESKPTFKMPEKVIDPKDFQTALEYIALDFLQVEIDELEEKMPPSVTTKQIGVLQRIRGTILDHGLEFRLAKAKEGQFGIPKEICKVQLVQTLYPMDADLLSSIIDLFYNEGH